MADYFLLPFKLLKDEHKSKNISRGRKLTVALAILKMTNKPKRQVFCLRSQNAFPFKSFFIIYHFSSVEYGKSILKVVLFQ